MTYEEREAALGRMMMKRRIEQMGEKWFEDKREREAAAIDLYRRNQEGGKLGGRNKHLKRKAGPHPTAILVNRLLLKGIDRKEIAEEAGIQTKSLNAIIRRNNLPNKDLENDY